MYVLGVHSDGDYFKVALLKTNKGVSRIVFLEEFKKEVVDFNRLKARMLSEPGLNLEDLEIASALTPDEVFARSLSFPFKNEKAIYKALPFQIEKLLPMSSEHITTHAEIHKEKSKANVTLYSYFNENLESHIEEVKKLGLDSDLVTTVSRALQNFKEFFLGLEGSIVLLYLGWERSYVVYSEGKSFKESLLIETGFKDFVDAAREDFPSATIIDTAFIKKEIGNFYQKQLIEGSLKEVFLKLQKHIYRAFEFIKKKEKIESLNLSLLGYSEIAETFFLGIKDKRYFLQEIAPHLEFARPDLKAYALEIGLALEGAVGFSNHAQFRQGELLSEKWKNKLKANKKRLFISSVTFSIFTLMLSTIGLFLGGQSIKKEFSELIRDAQEKRSVYTKLNALLVSKEDLIYESKRLYEKIKPKKETKQHSFRACRFRDLLEKIPDHIKIEELSYDVVEEINFQMVLKVTSEKTEVFEELKKAFPKEEGFHLSQVAKGKGLEAGVYELQISG
jgi:hypothetical protein